MFGGLGQEFKDQYISMHNIPILDGKMDKSKNMNMHYAGCYKLPCIFRHVYSPIKNRPKDYFILDSLDI